MRSPDAVVLLHRGVRNASAGSRVGDANLRVWATGHLGAVDALAAEMGLAATATDDELIAAAYQRWGLRLAEHLCGQFAAVIADGRAGQVVLVRDQLGQIPLFYALRADHVVVSPHEAAVADHPLVQAEPDLDVLALISLRCFVGLAPRSRFRSVAKVKPGTILSITATSVTEHRYFRPEEFQRAPRGRARDHADEVRATVTAAVADALPRPGDGSLGGVAAQASGGLDSTSVATIAGQQLRQRGSELLAGYSWSPPPVDPAFPLRGDRPDQDERHLTELISRVAGWPVIYANPTAQSRAEIAASDPLRTPLLAWQWESWCATDAVARGASVMLTGWGGDQGITHHGRGVVLGMLRRGQWLAAGIDIRAKARLFDRSPAGMLRQQAQLALMPTSQRLRGQRRPAPPSAELSRLLGELAEYAPEACAAYLRYQARPRPQSTAARFVFALSNGDVAARNESWFAGGAALGLAYRHPLQDVRVVSLALRLPERAFEDDGWSRAVYRYAMAPVMPAELVWHLGKRDPTVDRQRARWLESAAEQRTPGPKTDAGDAESAASRVATLSREIMAARARAAANRMMKPPPVDPQFHRSVR